MVSFASAPFSLYILTIIACKDFNQMLDWQSLVKNKGVQYCYIPKQNHKIKIFTHAV